MDRNQPGYSGFKDYGRMFLKIYDPWVAGVVAPRVWKLLPEHAIALYREHMGQRHLDVGPGTGYFIDHAEPPEGVDLTLLDANPHVLDHCAERLAHLEPTTVEANVLLPLPVEGPFDSAAMAHVIHCLPGPMDAKATAVEHVASVLSDEGVLFGGTVLGMSADHSRSARAFLRIANRQGGFDNLDDDVEGLRRVLSASFRHVQIDLPTPSVAYFVAEGPRRPEDGTAGV